MERLLTQREDWLNLIDSYIGAGHINFVSEPHLAAKHVVKERARL